ncbi:MAG: tyrosine-type recombinase/integrase, partial [Desulfovibrionaceae bacterium]
RVDLREDFQERLKAWKAEDDKQGIPWVIHYRKKPVTSVKGAWKRACEKVGITRGIRPYDLRHAFATEVLAQGGDVKAVAEIMGHADTTMIHKHYQHVLNKQKKAAIDKLPSLG